ncbi:MAG: diguanylate cyclase domain-containing protein [Methylobacter sp.]
MMRLSVCLLIFFLAAITARADNEPLEVVNLQLKWLHQFQFAGYYAAKEKGFYRDVGLDVNIIEAVPGVDPIQQVVAGHAEYGVGTSELLLNRYRGEPVVVLGVIFQHSPLSLITLQSSGLDHVHKLVKRRLMVEPNSAELLAYFYKEGFTEKAFNLQSHSLDINDLLSGATDAMSVYVTDELYLLEKQNIAYYEFSPRMASIDFYGDNFFTLERELKQHPERVDRFIAATQRGWRYAMQYPEEIVQLIYQHYSQRHSLDHLRYEAQKMRDLMRPELIAPGYMHIGRWQHIAQTYHQLGQLPAGFDVGSMLYFPSSEDDLQRLKTGLYYTGAGLSILILISLTLFRFYRAAKINESRLNIMFDNAPLSLILLDEQQQVRRWNSQAEKTFLWSSSEIMGQNIMVLVPPDLQGEIKKVLDTVQLETKVIRYENANLKKDGSELVCEWMNAPFKSRYDKNAFTLCMAQDITERKSLEKRLEQAAYYDNLTGLANRAMVLELLTRAIAHATRQQTKLAIFFLDLNSFKPINDRLGHEAGDQLLKMIAKRLQGAVRETDTVGRLGGDEFLILLQDVDSLEIAQYLANKLHEQIQRPFSIKNETLTVTASIGISLYPDEGEDIYDLIHLADQNMYRHKYKERDAQQLTPCP